MKRRVLIDGDVLDDLYHAAMWRKTKRTLSRNGTWYHSKIRPDEATCLRGNRNGYQTSYPNDTCEPFHAIVAGFAWDAATNQARTLYRCPPCGMLFNLSEYDTPQYAVLQNELTSG